jgi:hypothetical protein
MVKFTTSATAIPEPAPFFCLLIMAIIYRISGDRLAAQDARAEIERQVEELRRYITLSQIPIIRGRHQFIVGDGGDSCMTF